MTAENTPADQTAPAPWRPSATLALSDSNLRALNLGAGFHHAVHAAIQNLPVKARIVAPEHMDGYKIVRNIVAAGETTYHVYDESAWTKPSTAPMLPWSAPVGEIVALVSTDGFVTIL